MYYELDNNKIDSIFNQSDDKQNPIIVNKVDTQSIKKNTNSDYYEKNYETYNIDKLFSWGKKIYENTRKKRANELLDDDYEYKSGTIDNKNIN